MSKCRLLCRLPLAAGIAVLIYALLIGFPLGLYALKTYGPGWLLTAMQVFGALVGIVVPVGLSWRLAGLICSGAFSGRGDDVDLGDASTTAAFLEREWERDRGHIRWGSDKPAKWGFLPARKRRKGEEAGNEQPQ